MKKYLITVMLFCSMPLFAQSPNGISLYDGMYSKEWEKERDELNNDKSSPAALENAAKKWNMNGGLHPEMTSKGLRSGYKSGKSSTGTHSSSYSKEFLESRREAMERAREEALRKERERKERIARENAADFRNAYNAKMMSSSAYYQDRYANDKYKMGEGAKELDKSLRGMDYANMPDVRTDSYDLKEENELLDIMQNGINNPQHVKLHVDSEGYYDSHLGNGLVADKADEALALKKQKEAEEARQEALKYVEELKKSKFDFSSLLPLISVKGDADYNKRENSEEEKTEYKSTSESDKEEPVKRQRTYEEYLYELSQNGGKDFTPEDWIIFNKMIDSEDKLLDKELDKENNKN